MIEFNPREFQQVITRVTEKYRPGKPVAEPGCVQPWRVPLFASVEECSARDGNDQYGAKGFVEDCKWTPQYPALCRRSVAFCDGPPEEGATQDTAYTTRWALWRTGAGELRYGRFTDRDHRRLLSQEGELLGARFALFDEGDYHEICLAFDQSAEPVVCVESPPGTLVLKREVIGVPQTFTWSGSSPVLFYNGILNDDPSLTDVVVYYIKEGITALFARFQRDNFGVEYTVNDDLESAPERLLRTDVFEGNHVILAHSNERTVRYTSGTYPFFRRYYADRGNTGLVVPSGEYFLTVVETDIFEEPGSTGLVVPSGEYIPVIVVGARTEDDTIEIYDPSSPPPVVAEPGSTGLVVPSGVYAMVIVQGGDYEDEGSTGLVVPSGVYATVIVQGGTYTEAGSTGLVVPSGVYALA